MKWLDARQPVTSTSNPNLRYSETALSFEVCTVNSIRLMPTPGAHAMPWLSILDATPCDQCSRNAPSAMSAECFRRFRLSADCCKKPYGLAWREAEKQQAVHSACDTLDELTLLLDC